MDFIPGSTKPFAAWLPYPRYLRSMTNAGLRETKLGADDNVVYRLIADL
ncbi:MAG: hypothetical protein ABIO49_05765 [Dokdonella sp.]